jgi:hypothetical protein
MVKRYLVAGSVLFVAALTTPAQSTAQADARWLAFEGCWRATQATPGSITCVVAERDGMRVIALNNGNTISETRVTADGQARPVSQEGCSGDESARWSPNGRRVYMSTQMSCGSQIGRNSTGILALVSAREWVSINAISVDNEAAVRTVRYELVDAPTSVPESILTRHRENRLARETARYAASAPLELADVAEASKQVHGRAVEALLFERKQVFNLDGKKLLALSDAGVPGYLIDAVVAVSHPDKFALRETGPVELEEITVPTNRRSSGYGSRYFCDDFDFGYDRYCSNSMWYSPYSSFGYSPFGYGRYGYGYRSNPVIVVVNPNGSEPAPHGRVTRRGYSSGRTTGTSSTVRSASSGSSSSPGRSSSGSSSSGTSSTSSSSSGDRGKAIPKR